MSCPVYFGGKMFLVESPWLKGCSMEHYTILKIRGKL